MARPHVISQDTLLDAIRSAFLEHGPGTSTSQLAAAAAVSEGTLFKRFGNKRRMFQLAMAPPELSGPWFDDMLELAGKGDLRENLALIASGVTNHVTILIPRIFCAHSSGIPSPKQSRKLFGEAGSPSHQIRQRLTRFFEIEVAAERVRPLPARHLTDLFHGALHHQVAMSIIFPDEIGRLDPDSFGRELAETFHALVAIG